MSQLKYRREIDGLRAVAVLPVILFHAGFEIFSGGYVGVDVFFVISGYLITTILIDEFDSKSFSLIKFYERRARRILPALFFVMLACLPFAWLWMLPDQLASFSRGLIAVSLFSSNILFWRESNYFEPSSEENPLLHTWSLAVEEQYYIFFPIFLMLTWRFGKSRVFWCIVLFSILSFLLSEWGWRNNPTANFYLAPTRAWELFAGSIVAFIIKNNGITSNNFLSGLGLTAVIFSIFAFDKSTPFPSVYTLVPVIGVVLLILFAEQKTLAGKILGTKLMVGIGLISYSAYLWHQPLFAFARIRTLTEPSLLTMAGLSGVTLVLAWLTWRIIEQPFRTKAHAFTRSQKNIFSASLLGTIAFLALGLSGHMASGFAGRYESQILKYEASKSDRPARDCIFGPDTSLPRHPQSRCTQANSDGEVRLLLIGDSHAWSISEELGNLLKTDNIGFYKAFYSGCAPIPNLRRGDQGLNHRCDTFNEMAYDYAKNSGIETVLLSARFPLYLHGNRYDNGEGGKESGGPAYLDVTNVSGSTWDSNKRRERVLKAYETEIRRLAKDFNVVLVDPIPVAGWNVPDYLIKNRIYNGVDSGLSTPFDNFKKRSEDVTNLFQDLAAEIPNIHLALVQEALCSDETGRCINSTSDDIYYFDDDHLNSTGARLVAPIIMSSIKNASK